MNLEDDSYLSAYLDDELDPADRLAVEWSVESSPPLADRLRSIALAREAVASLDRPSIPRDLAPALGARIALNRQRDRLQSFARPAQILGAFSAFSAIAASLIFALIRLNTPLHETPEAPIVVTAVEPNVPASSPRTHHSDPIPLQAMAPAPLVKNAVDAIPENLPNRIAVLSQPPDEAAERDNRRLIGGILGRPHVRRILIVTDMIDAPKEALDLIVQEPRERPEFGRISIRQEIVVDADHAEAAEVFAVPIDERGRRSFVDKLQKVFPDLVEEGQTSPQLVTQLTEVGQVAVLRGREAAPLGDPPRNLPSFIANREETAKAPFILEIERNSLDPSGSLKSVPVAGPVVLRKPDQAGSFGDLNFVGPPDLNSKPPPDPAERITLLVWVTRPGRR